MSEMLSFPFVRIALLASAIIGSLCAFLGIHVVLRRIVFVGAALAEISALGVAAAVLMEWNPIYCSIGATFLGVLLLSFKRSRGRVPEDGYIGVGYATAWAASILLIYAAHHGEAHMRELLQGEILSMTEGDLSLLAAVFGGIALLHVVFFKEFWMVSFDPEMAQTLGLRAWLWNFLFYLSLGGAISIAIHDAGVLLVFSYLVMPPITGLLSTRRKGGVIAIAILSALIASVAGVWISFNYEEVSTGPAIVMCSFALSVLAWIKNRIFG
jgi:ABC-type Mn2+/Zn2+ transport system permease subunit